MIRTKARRTSFLLAALAFAARLRVAAAEPSAAVAAAHLELDADPSCTNREDLIERVRARSPRVRFVDDSSGLSIRVRIGLAASGAVAADVTLTSSGTKPSIRHVPARSCTEASDAVALIIAVTLDPASVDTRVNASTAKVGAVPTAPAANSVTEAASRSDASKSDAAVGSPASPGPKPPWPGPTGNVHEAIAATARTESRSRVNFGAQVGAESFVGVAPGVMPGVALFAIAGLDRPSVWSPALVLAGHHAWRTGVQEQGGSASFTLDAATLDVCPVRFRFAVLEARPCGSALVGRFAARATDTFNSAGKIARPFWVLGGAAVVTADFGGVLEASMRLAAGANLVRDSFEFSPAIFHTVPPVSAAASVGIGLRWR
ncbi:MAG: hypothetical protein WDO69_11765 [Pseudomonadota bacterium]